MGKDNNEEIESNEELLYSFANIPPKIHQFGINVKLNVWQPGYRKFPHAPCVRVFRKSFDESFSIGLEDSDIKVVSGKSFLKGKELNILFEGIRKYRIPLLMMWFDEAMDILELRNLMDQIDKGIKLALPQKLT